MVKTNINTKKNRKNSVLVLSQELFFVLFVLAIVCIFQPARTDAATLDVAAGSAAVNDGDNICQLDEALANISYATQNYTDCVEVGAFGTEDTINLPVGTVTGDGSDRSLWGTNSLTITGQGRDKSILNNIGLYGSSVDNLVLRNFTMKGAGIGADSPENMVVENIEVDLQGNNTGALMIQSSENLEVRDSYFHNGDMSGSGLIQIFNNSNAISNVSFDRVTISHMPLWGIGLINSEGSGVARTMNVSIKNTTITDISNGIINQIGSGSGLEIADFFSAAGITVANPSNDGSVINYTTINNTYSNITNVNAYGKASAILEVDLGAGAGRINHTSQNNLYAVGNGNAVNYRRLSVDNNSGVISANPNAANFNTVSNGGNVSSDNSLSSWLTQPTDKHNETTLASFLGVLADNGGTVPTLALLEGSPAINAGTPVSFATDARGAARMQVGAVDAGSYESPFAAAPKLAATGQNARLATFVAGLLALGGGIAAVAHRLKSRAKLVLFR